MYGRALALALFALVATNSSCSGGSDTSRTTIDESLYGVWTWSNRYVLVLLRSGTYVFCDESVCFKDSLDLSNENYVWLENFYRQPLAQKFGTDAFRNDTAFKADRAAVSQSARPFDLDFYPNRPLASSSRARCKIEPCVAIGHLVDGALFSRVVAF
jgi:hypothetical protein